MIRSLFVHSECFKYTKRNSKREKSKVLETDSYDSTGQIFPQGYNIIEVDEFQERVDMLLINCYLPVYKSIKCIYAPEFDSNEC